MKLALSPIRALLPALVLWMTACFNPQLADPGYYCDPTAIPACPGNQLCQDGRCVGPNYVAADDLSESTDDANVTDGVDQSVTSTADMAAKSVDAAKPPQDLTVTTPITLDDLSTPAADMTKHKADLATACVGTGGDCYYHLNSACCSNYCIYSSNTCQ